MNMPPTPSIAAVFATLNRCETAVECVKSLASQTTPPNWVIVADNHSSDATGDKLEQLVNLPFELLVLRLPMNSGNTGGISHAIDKALELEASHVWILDDDSWPRPDCLELLLASDSGHDTVVHPIQIDPTSSEMSWPMWKHQHGKWKIFDTLDELPESRHFNSRCAWVGALISTSIIRKVGNVNTDLFIRGEDEEYPWRISKAGYHFLAVSDAILDHPGPKRMIHLSLLSHHFFYEPDIPDWKSFYRIRNMVWFKRHQGKHMTAVAMVAAYIWATIRYDKSPHPKLAWQACIDGWRGKLGKWKRHSD